MRVTVRQLLVLGAMVPVAGCVHPGQYRRDLADTRAQIAQEKADRAAGDSSLSGQVAGVRTDLAALRSDLDSMRTEFGAKITQLQDGMKFDMPVTFGFNDATVAPDDDATLNRFSDIVKKYYGGSKITIEGFADPAGSKRYNLVLSQKRADAVREYLAQQGVDVAALKTVGYGKARLVNPGAAKDAPGAEENRRVVFVIETKSDQQQQQQPTGHTTASTIGVSGAGE
jgi:outer membrane protein OmpA-like peptidoglycan-associated protein